MLADVTLREKQSMLPTVLVETDATVQYREVIESFLDSIREKALQHMNDPNILAAAIAVQRKLDKATTAKQVADVFFQGSSLKRFKSGAAIRFAYSLPALHVVDWGSPEPLRKCPSADCVKRSWTNRSRQLPKGRQCASEVVL